jgi:drug/metabolite transporter (DMT)-like permease
MDPSQLMRLRRLRSVAVLTALLLASTGITAVVAAGTQLREASLHDLVRDTGLDNLVASRVADAEDQAGIAALTGIGLALLSLIAFALFVSSARRLASEQGHRVQGRGLSALWQATGGAPSRAFSVGWVLLIGGAALWIPTLLDHSSAGGRRIWAAGLTVIGLWLLLGAGYVVAQLLRFWGVSWRLPTRSGVAVAVAAALVAVVSTGTAVTWAAQLPSGLTGDVAAPVTDRGTPVTGGETQAANGPGYLLKTDRFSVRLPAKPHKTTSKTSVSGGTLTVTQWEVQGYGGDVIVEELGYSFQIDSNGAAKTILEQTAKVLGGTTSNGDIGVVDGHPYHEAVITNEAKRKTGMRAVGLPTAVVVVIASPSGRLAAVTSSLRVNP